jgi:D-beta-D-heptose 7-phosphate kinase/D-beta-D-heptose 1-phosphate adenosyltransferase
LGQVISQDDLILQRQIWKGNGQSMVFVSGWFDLLHPGHVRLLEQARSYGDVLVVGVKSDCTVSAQNAYADANGAGSKFGREITPAAERAEILSELAAVDYVVEFEGESANPLMKRLRPEIVVESASSPINSASAPQVTPEGESGIKAVRILREPGFSTEHLLARITQSSRSPA